MARPLSPDDIAAKNLLDVDIPWRWLYEIEVPTDPPKRARLVRDSEQITFGFNSNGVPNTYYPAAVTHGLSTTASDGAVQTVDLSLSNVSREIQALVEEHNGLIGQNVTLHLVNKPLVLGGANVAVKTERYQILETVCRETTVTAKLGVHNPYRVSFPNRRYLRDHCGYQYRGPRCQYSGLLDSCDKSLNGANGCIVHENQERFGGHPGIPRIGER